MIEFGHGTHVGLRRTRNEDTYYADPGLGLFLVADGMGGHLHGEVASALARDVLVERISAGDRLIDAVHATAEHLQSRARKSHDALPMGTTLAALRLLDQDYELAWVGDSRIYRHDRRLQQVSHDHSLVQELVKAGQLDPELASRHPQRNVLTQALGITAADQLHIGFARGGRTPGTGFLLCTDGLTEDLGITELEHTLSRRDLAAQECVDHLMLQALAGGGSDNISAILVRLS